MTTTINKVTNPTTENRHRRLGEALCVAAILAAALALVAEVFAGK